MRIRAIRLRELGCFSDPIALEGLSGGLDVLAGPNELGKSTILTALRTLFTVRHSAQSRFVESLRPYGGGAPLVEADFEAEGKLWRLRKQYLNERQTVLTDLTAGQVAARGDEAHMRALELIGRNGEEHGLGLIWLEQGALLEPARLAEGERSLLGQVIEREIATASAGGHELRAIRARILQQRREIVTDQRSLPRGAFAEIIANRNEAERELEAARIQARAAADRLAQAEVLRNRRTNLKNPSVISARQERVAKLKRSHEEALAARQQLKIAEAKVEACASREAEARRAHDYLARSLAAVAELEAALSASDVQRRALEVKQEALSRGLDEAREQRDELRRELERERQQLQARLELDRRREAAVRLAEASTRLAEARSASQRVDELRHLLAADKVTEERVSAAAREAASIATLEARISAQLPKVRISYEPGGVGKILADGRPLPDGALLTPSRPLALYIEGVGTITVDPAVSESIEEDEADLAAHRSVLADLLAGIGVGDLDEARKRLAERQRLERELEQAADRVETRAPHGLERLVQEVERLTELAKGDESSVGDADDLPDRPALEAAAERLECELRKAEAGLERLIQQQSEAREELARHAAESRARGERLAALNSELPPADQRSERLTAAGAALAAALEAVNEAVRERTAWREKAPDDAQLRALEAELAEAQRQEQNAAEELAKVERELAVLERDIERDSQDGLSSRVSELEQQVASYREQVRQFERELAALNLLLETLDEVERQSRDRYFGPVVQRLKPYVHLIFPGAEVSFDQNLGVEAIVRRDVREPLQALSDGTQEQISVLVRLAFARLLADAGRPTPLILDDALVYSDDQRIETLFDVLRQAAASHQVIVFTCRSRTFDQLGGTRLKLERWAA